MIFEIFTFLNYANQESDDVKGGSTKTVQHSMKNFSRYIKAVFFKLGSRNVNHKRNKMTLVMFDQMVVGLRILSSTSTVERHQTRGANGKLVSKQCFIAKRLFTAGIEIYPVEIIFNSLDNSREITLAHLYSTLLKCYTEFIFSHIAKKKPLKWHKCMFMHMQISSIQVAFIVSFPLILFLKF